MKEEPGWAAEVKPETYKRDAAFVEHFYQALRGDYWGTHPGQTDSVLVDGLYYSPDRLKIVVLVTERIVSREEFDLESKHAYTYSSSALIGYRGALGEPWALYGFSPTKYFGFREHNEVQTKQRRFFFKHLKYAGERVMNSEGAVITRRYGKNLGEHGFWESMIWQKGQRIPGMYNFQARPQRVGGDPRRFVPREETVVRYPPELLRQFELEKE